MIFFLFELNLISIEPFNGHRPQMGRFAKILILI